MTLAEKAELFRTAGGTAAIQHSTTAVIALISCHCSHQPPSLSSAVIALMSRHRSHNQQLGLMTKFPDIQAQGLDFKCRGDRSPDKICHSLCKKPAPARQD